MINRDVKKDIKDKKLIDLKEVAKILGLKYHTARKILYNSTSIGFVNYGSKKLWLLEDILEYKCSCYIEPKSA